jgi:nucleotide-binding universal stress UspA family protein
MMYKRIIVAVDGSETGDRALKEAVKFAGGSEAKLRIVHVVDDVSMSRDSKIIHTDRDLEEAHEAALGMLEKAVAAARESDVDAESKMLKRDKMNTQVADLIAAEAEQWPADLIVVGTHGRQGMRRLLLGSVAESIARVASKPVLLVRGE